jgi:RNA polymerase sigma-70 factor (ECF subfamily)
MSEQRRRLSSDEERALLERARQLDPSAFGAIYDAYHDALYRYILNRVRHVQTAEDLTADVFSQLVRTIGDRRGPSEYLRAWLYRVARNLVIDEARRSRIRSTVELSPDLPARSTDLSAQAHRSILRQQAQAALDRLSARQREVLTLRYLEGLDVREVAEVLGTSERNVRALQERGLEAMRTLLVKAGVGIEDDDDNR